VRTALACLVRNAVEAAGAGGWARVRLLDGGTFAVVAVEDSGPGPDRREHLFDPFYSGRTAGRGRGLGLSLAWRLAEQQGGDVRFDGRPGGATRFTLRLLKALPEGSAAA
jgi:signal transduction histidine kinase